MNRQGVVVITGGAGGIGAATVEILVADGCSVALLDWTEMALEAQAEKLRASGGDVLTLPIDVRDSAAVTEGIAEAARHSPLVGAVHTAGVFDGGRGGVSRPSPAVACGHESPVWQGP